MTEPPKPPRFLWNAIGNYTVGLAPFAPPEFMPSPDATTRAGAPA